MFYNKYEPATSLWELWSSDSGNPTMDSRNHIYSASISTFLFKVIAGINAVLPGFDRVLIAPITVKRNESSLSGGLTSADAAVGTPHGVVSSSWELLGSPARASPCGTVPENAELIVGCGDIDVITSVQLVIFGTPIGSCAGGFANGTACPGFPNSTTVVGRRCLGNHTCSIPATIALFGDPCFGRPKFLAVSLGCGAGPTPPPASTSLYRHRVTVPIGTTADIVIPLLGENERAIKIMESGIDVWRDGLFVGETVCARHWCTHKRMDEPLQNKIPRIGLWLNAWPCAAKPTTKLTWSLFCNHPTLSGAGHYQRRF